MKIRTHRKIEGEVHIVEITTEDFSQDDEKLFDQIGQPDIQVGGSITSIANSPDDDFEQPTGLRRVKADFQPYRFGFDKGDHANADDMARSLQAAIEANIASEMASLRADNPDTFTGEDVTDI